MSSARLSSKVSVGVQVHHCDDPLHYERELQIPVNFTSPLLTPSTSFFRLQIDPHLQA